MPVVDICIGYSHKKDFIFCKIFSLRIPLHNIIAFVCIAKLLFIIVYIFFSLSQYINPQTNFPEPFLIFTCVGLKNNSGTQFQNRCGVYIRCSGIYRICVCKKIAIQYVLHYECSASCKQTVYIFPQTVLGIKMYSYTG